MQDGEQYKRLLQDALGLRRALDELTCQPTASHPELLSALKVKIENSIEIIPSQFILSRYTCLMYALGFEEQSAYVAIASSGSHDVYAGTDFAHWLLHRRHLLEVEEATALLGDIVIYFDGFDFKHIGLWQGGDRVRSKWGVGQLYAHQLNEVPSSYGDNVRFFRRISVETAITAFLDFARERGVEEV